MQNNQTNNVTNSLPIPSIKDIKLKMKRELEIFKVLAPELHFLSICFPFIEYFTINLPNDLKVDYDMWIDGKPRTYNLGKRIQISHNRPCVLLEKKDGRTDEEVLLNKVENYPILYACNMVMESILESNYNIKFNAGTLSFIEQ